MPGPETLLDALLQLGRDIHLDMSEGQLARRFLAALETMLPGRLIAIRMLEPHSAEHVVVATRGAHVDPAARSGRLVLKFSAVKKSGLVPTRLPGRVVLSETPAAVFLEAKAGFSVPLVAAGTLYGSLDVGVPDAPAGHDEDESLAILMANHLSVALRNIRLHRESEGLRTYLANLVEHANALILGVDRNWRVTVFNRAIMELLGYDPAEVFGRDVRQWLSAEERVRLETEVAHALAGHGGQNIEVTLPTRAGGEVRTVWNVAAVGHGRDIEAVTAVGQDVTRLESLERQVIHAEKLATLGQLAAGVVHELNNPLTSIRVYADYLLKKVRGGDPLAEDDERKLERIQEGAERILKFTRELTEYARPSGDRLDPLALNDVVKRSVSFCEHVVSSRGIELVLELAGNLPAILGAPSQLQQVVVNLVTNAAHAMGEAHGRIRVRTFRKSAKHVAFLVEDNGSGMTTAEQKVVFEPFFTTKTGGQGTGLGLSIVRNIVERHAGTISVDSELGRGTTFTVTLPAA